MKKTIEIKGMSCGHCVKRVNNALNSIEGVQATVSLESKSAIINTEKEIADNVLVEAIEDAGYKVVSIK